MIPVYETCSCTVPRASGLPCLSNLNYVIILGGVDQKAEAEFSVQPLSDFNLHQIANENHLLSGRKLRAASSQSSQL